MYDHDLGELEDLGWDEFIRRQWDAVYTAYRTGRGRRTLCRGWADLLEAGLSCSQSLADLLVRMEILDRADRDLEGTVDPRALVIGMTEVIADVRVDLLELGQRGEDAELPVTPSPSVILDGRRQQLGR